jgi:thiamine phosphate synthase YjbQ (UPF0047 family)
MVITREFNLSTKGFCDIHNITEAVAEAVQRSGLKHGTVTVFTPSATSAITTVEYESGMLKDFEGFFERVASQAWEYKHYHHQMTTHGHQRTSWRLFCLFCAHLRQTSLSARPIH